MMRMVMVLQIASTLAPRILARHTQATVAVVSETLTAMVMASPIA
jgi:hypothetical protein